MTPSEQCKKAGLKSFAELSRTLRVSEQTLINWHNVMAGMMDFKSDRRYIRYFKFLYNRAIWGGYTKTSISAKRLDAIFPSPSRFAGKKREITKQAHNWALNRARPGG